MTVQDVQWLELRRGNVYPLPLATETSWTADGFTIDLVIVTDVSQNGYGTTQPIFSRVYPYLEDDRSEAAAARAHQEFLNDTAQRLSDVMATDPRPH